MLTNVNTAPLIVEQKNSVLKAAEQMISARATCMVVVDEHQQIAGIVTRGDLLVGLVKALGDGNLERMAKQAIATLMTRPVEFVYFASLLSDIKRLYLSEKIEHFPLLRNHGPPSLDNLVGVINGASLVQKFLS